MSVQRLVRNDPWSRDVAKMLVGWLVGTLLAVVLIFTVVKWAFVGVV